MTYSRFYWVAAGVAPSLYPTDNSLTPIASVLLTTVVALDGIGRIMQLISSYEFGRFLYSALECRQCNTSCLQVLLKPLLLPLETGQSKIFNQ
jgi:hypothetical protein